MFLGKRASAAVFCISMTLSPLLNAAGPRTLRDIGWLSGTWKLESKSGAVIEEYWMTPAGGLMIGMSRTVKNGKTSSFEFLRIAERDGTLIYIAQPEGKPPTEFKLSNSSEGEVVFSNLQHDFPQRVRYRQVGKDEVAARIEDESGKKGVDFPYHRVQ